jgi:CBS domain-containing protein
MILVEDFMNTKMVSRGADASVLEIAKTMAEWKISAVAVTDDNGKKILGILTERDIVKNIAKGISPDRVSSRSLMSSSLVSIRNDRPIGEAAHLMIKNKVRHLLVEDASHAVSGIITTTDLARYLKQTITSSATSAVDKKESTELLSEAWELFF